MNGNDTSRSRASRIPLDYHHGWDSLSRAKWMAVGLAAAAGVLYLFGGWLWGSSVRYSHGPLAAVHATWEDRCETCHVPFAPMRADGMATSWMAFHSQGDLPWGRAADANCQQCHQGKAGQEHHKNQIVAEVPACAACHQDHQGKLADLKRVANAACLNCHRDLQTHVAQVDALREYKNVTSFATAEGHPPFGSLAHGDPGKIKFPHDRHLRSGMFLATTGESKEKHFALEDLAPEDRLRYQRFAAAEELYSSVLKLDCSACHRLDITDEANAPLRGFNGAGGKYFLPVTYDNDCRACHPLPFEPGKHEAVIPHGMKPGQIRGWLIGHYAEELAEGPGQPKVGQPNRPIPGKDRVMDSKSAMQIVAEKVRHAESFLGKQCAKCHEYAESPHWPTEVFPRQEIGVVSSSVPEVHPPGSPQVWLPRARFDHAAHRAVNCESCHPKSRESKVAADVLIPDREVCRQCHAPPVVTNKGLSGGARFDCVECHRYHGGMEPRHGAGSLLRGPSETLDIPAFLSGGRIREGSR